LLSIKDTISSIEALSPTVVAILISD